MAVIIFIIPDALYNPNKDKQSSFIFITIGYSHETCVGTETRVIMYQCRKSRTTNSSRATKRYPGSARRWISQSDDSSADFDAAAL